MKNYFKNSLAFFLSAVILVSSTGVVLAAHHCFSSHGTEVSLFQHEGCCSKEERNCHSDPLQENAVKRECCQLTITYHKVDVSSPLAKFFSLPTLNLFPVEFFSFSSFIFTSSALLCTVNKAPPLARAGVSLLISIHTLLI